MYGLMLIGSKLKNNNNLIGFEVLTVVAMKSYIPADRPLQEINYYFMLYLETYIIYKHEKI
jgi:hypothetical protein